MPEKTQKRKLRSDQSTSQVEIENYNYPNDENPSLPEQDFEDISSKVENRLSKRLRDTEFGQREILRLIENLTSMIDRLSNPASLLLNNVVLPYVTNLILIPWTSQEIILLIGTSVPTIIHSSSIAFQFRDRFS